jgi:hypothetical protein
MRGLAVLQSSLSDVCRMGRTMRGLAVLQSTLSDACGRGRTMPGLAVLQSTLSPVSTTPVPTGEAWE